MQRTYGLVFLGRSDFGESGDPLTFPFAMKFQGDNVKVLMTLLKGFISEISQHLLGGLAHLQTFLVLRQWGQ